MQSLKVLVVFVALSQVECAPSSILPAHRFSPPELWPFKQPASAPAPLSVFTHFREPTPSPFDIALPAETLLVEPIIDVVTPVPAEVIIEETALPAEIIVPEVVEVESAPQPQEPIVFISENVKLVQEVVDETVTDVPAVTSAPVTTAAPASYTESETYRAYEQFINTWLQQASITLNRPDLLNMVSHPQQNVITPEESPAKQSVSKSVEKSVEKVVEQVTVSESVEPSITPVEVLSPEINEISKKISGPPKKTPATVVSKSAIDAPLVADIDIINVNPAPTPEPVPSPEVAVASEPLEATIIAADPAPESQNLETVAALELIPSELVPENPPVQEQTISDVDLIAEESLLQPVVVPQPTVEEFIPYVQPQLPVSSYNTLSVAPDGTIILTPNPPATSSSPSIGAISTIPKDTSVTAKSLNTAQSPLVKAILESDQPTVIDSVTQQGLTYTLRYFPRQRSSFFYSHALGG